MVLGYGSSLINGSNPLTQQFSNATALNLGQLNQVSSALLNANVMPRVVQLNLSYGSLTQNGKLTGAGKTLYYVGYDGNATYEYVVNVNKGVPYLHARIGGFDYNSSMGNMSLVASVYRKVGDALYPSGNYSISPQLFSSLLGNNTLNYTYSIYTGGLPRAAGSFRGSGINKSFSFSGIPISKTTRITFDVGGNANYTAVDPTIYVFYTTTNSSVTMTAANTLAGDFVCGSLTIQSGVTLTTDGYSILCNGTVTNSGTISSGNPANGGPAGSVGGSATSSYGGSGGGGGGYNNAGSSGSTPTSPTLSVANIQTWYGSGGLAIQSYFDGAGGGGSADVGGGSGSYGVYIQGNKVVEGTVNVGGVAGTVDTGSTKTAGQNGGSTLATGGNGGAASGHGAGTSACGGGGGGGIILAAYGSGGFTTGTTTVTGGSGTGCTEVGGTGGGGRALSYSYGATAPIVVLEQLQPPAAISSATLDVGQSYAFSTMVSYGVKPYTGNWLWYAPSSSGLSSGNTVASGLTGTGSNTLSLTLSPLSDTDLRYTFNSINYDITTTNPNLIEGTWTFNGLIKDAGSEVVSTSNTPVININSAPTVTLSPSASSLSPGQTETFTITVNGGTGPFNALLYNITGSKQQGSNVVISSPGGSNTISFVANAVGTFTFNAVVTDTGTTAPFTVNSANSVITVSAAACQISLSTNSLGFGNIIASKSYNTNQIVTDNNIGNAPTYLWVYGTNWISGGNNFGVSNTVWDATSDSSFVGNVLSLISSNTGILIPASSGSNSIYFGLRIPAGQVAATYTQNIVITNVC